MPYSQSDKGSQCISRYLVNVVDKTAVAVLFVVSLDIFITVSIDNFIGYFQGEKQIDHVSRKQEWNYRVI